MSSAEVNILNAAKQVFTQTGLAGANMTQIARAAGVSRQTVYAYFPTKEELMIATTRHVATEIMAQLQAALPRSTTLSEALDLFFDVSIRGPFDVLQNHPEMQHLLRGTKAAAAQISAQSDTDKVALLAKCFAPHTAALNTKDTTPQALAQYVVHASKALKYDSSSRAQLDASLSLLKTSVLALI